MENGLAEVAQSQPRRRRHRKSSKESYQRRRRWKSIGFWVLLCVIGAAIVTGIAVYAGSSTS
jgi:hypothetical protein